MTAAEFKLGQLVRIGGSADRTATITGLSVEEDASGAGYVMALLVDSRGRAFREETCRLVVVRGG